MTQYHFLEIYEAGGSVRGQFISNQHYALLRREHERYFNLSNQKVCYLFVVSDHAVPSEVAAEFAQRVANGRVVHHHIDLSQIGRMKLSGKKGRK